MNIIWSGGFACLHGLKRFYQVSSGKWGWHVHILAINLPYLGYFPSDLSWEVAVWVVKQPFCCSCNAIVLALTGHLLGLDAVLPVRRLIVCQAFRLESVKSMNSTVSIQRSWSFSSKRLIKMLAVSSDPSLDVAAVWSSYSCWHSLSQHGM